MMRDWNNDIIDTSEFDFDAALNAILNDIELNKVLEEDFNSLEDDLRQSDLCFDPQTY